MYRINEIKLKPYDDLGKIPEEVRRKLNARDLVMSNINIVKESIDARHGKVKRVFTVDFDSNIELNLPEAPDLTYRYTDSKGPEDRPVIVGFGPCGIFCGLIMAQMGFRPIIIERGRDVDSRTKDVLGFWQGGSLNTESNVQFGEGGAGAFSDGKLTTGIRDPRIKKVLEEFVTSGGDKEILRKQKPHIGTDKLKNIIKDIRKRITELGGEVRFESKLTGFEIDDNGKIRLEINENSEIVTSDLVLAIGHSARDTFRMLRDKGIDMVQKPFSVGVRIRHPQSLINRTQYGDEELAKVLGPAEYKLSCHTKDKRGVYTFCMCPGGEVILASSESGMVVINGMSYHARSGKFANSGLLVDVRCSDFGSDDVLAGVEFQRKYERLAYEKGKCYKMPEINFGNFDGSDVYECLPEFAAKSIQEAMPILGRKLKGFDDPRAMMFAVETRSSSPVRFPRNEYLMSNILGIYPAGEGAGHAGGIVSAAVDGIKVAEQIAIRYK